MSKVKTFVLIIGISIFILLAIGSTDGEEPKKETISVDEKDEKKNDNKEKKKDYTLTNTEFKNKDFELILGEINSNYKEKYMSIKEGFRVVKIPVTVKNLSSTDMFTDSFKAKSENKMLDDYYSSNDDSLVLKELLAGTSIEGAVYFEVPTDTKELTLVYDYGFWTDKKVEFKINLK